MIFTVESIIYNVNDLLSINRLKYKLDTDYQPNEHLFNSFSFMSASML